MLNKNDNVFRGLAFALLPGLLFWTAIYSISKILFFILIILLPGCLLIGIYFTKRNVKQKEI